MKQNEKIILVFKRVSFICQYGEDAFFEWLKKIKCVNDIVGVHDEIHAYVIPEKITYPDLLNLIGLFYLYKVKDMHQLAIFSQYLNDEDRECFESSGSFWEKKVFKNPTSV